MYRFSVQSLAQTTLYECTIVTQSSGAQAKICMQRSDDSSAFQILPYVHRTGRVSI